MGILSRFKTIMASNWNALVDKADDPEKTIDDLMRELTLDLGQVRAETAAVQAEERRAKRVLDECSSEIRKLRNYTEKSLQDGNEEAAVRFMERRNQLADKEAELKSDFETAAVNAASMKQIQDKLTDGLAQLEVRQAQLKDRITAAKAQDKLNTGSSPMGGRHEEAFRAAEEKANMAYNEAMALAELRGSKKDDVDELFAEFERNIQEKSKSGTDSSEKNQN